MSEGMQVVADALSWLLKHNRHYSDVEINQDALKSLSNNSVPDDLLSVETEETCYMNDNFSCSDSDFEDLLSTVQRHTHCSSAYSLRRKGK